MEGKRHRRGIICKMMLLLTPMVMPAKERESKMRADRRTRTEARNDDRAGKTAVSGIQSSDDCLFLSLFLSWRGGGGGMKMGMEGGKFQGPKSRRVGSGLKPGHHHHRGHHHTLEFSSHTNMCSV